MKTPDYDLIDRTLEERLRSLGLTPHRCEPGLDAGYEGLHLHRGETQVVTLEEPPGTIASVEVIAHIDHPQLGRVTVADLINTHSDTPEQAMATSAGYYMDVTFPALQALFDENAYVGKPIKISSVNPQGRAVEWKTFTGQSQILGDTTGGVAQFFQSAPFYNMPLVLVLDTITGYLGVTRLHWCKLYAAQTHQGITFGVSIDGHRSAEGEAEMRTKFRPALPQPIGWEFRQFLAFRPSHDLSPAEAATLRAQAAEINAAPRPSKPAKKPWWPFGGR